MNKKFRIELKGISAYDEVYILYNGLDIVNIFETLEEAKIALADYEIADGLYRLFLDTVKGSDD